MKWILLVLAILVLAGAGSYLSLPGVQERVDSWFGWNRGTPMEQIDEQDKDALKGVIDRAAGESR